MTQLAEQKEVDREEEVTVLYNRLWQDIKTFRTPAVIDQFLFNVALPREWFRNKCCIDVGCGSGFAVWVMQQLEATCHACDLGYKSLHIARESLGPDALLVTRLP